jgi:hypothetical protein
VRFFVTRKLPKTARFDSARVHVQMCKCANVQMCKCASVQAGWVVSDWGADHDSIASLNAGMDQTMARESERTRPHMLHFSSLLDLESEPTRLICTPPLLFAALTVREQPDRLHAFLPLFKARCFAY